MSSHTTPKTKKDKCLPTIPPTDAELRYATDGLTAIIPQTPANLTALAKNMEVTGKFDLEYSYYLRQKETLKDLAADAEMAALIGGDVELEDTENLPIKHQKIPTFKQFVNQRRITI